MANKIAFTGLPTNYAFQIAGRRILYAPVNTALPATVQPIYDTSLPVGWSDFGPTVNSVVDVSVDFNTAEIKTGVIGSVRRTYIESQTGKVSAKLFRYEPQISADAYGQGPIVSVGATSLNRSFKDLYLGGTLGPKIAILIFEDFDIPLIEDIVAANTYEQAWMYSPKTTKQGGINVSDFETKTNIVNLELELLPYTNTAAGGRDILLQVRWVGVT